MGNRRALKGVSTSKAERRERAVQRRIKALRAAHERKHGRIGGEMIQPVRRRARRRG